MNKSAPSSRSRLALLLAGAVAATALYWYFIIRNQQSWLSNIHRQITVLQEEVDASRRRLLKRDTYRQELEFSYEKLEGFESEMISGSAYRWIVRNILSLKTKEVDLLDVEAPRLAEVARLPRIPYQEARFVLTGEARYHNLGKFLADLENRFLHLQVYRLNVASIHSHMMTTGTLDDREQLLFEVELSMLIRPVPPPSSLRSKP